MTMDGYCPFIKGQCKKTCRFRNIGRCSGGNTGTYEYCLIERFMNKMLERFR